ncbi:MAG: type VI secretion system tip protein VgrG [Desulfobulbaceae bacterium]|jgi:type VI secretion system secreted protein VgrG|nr:type VI secretion system tip protein VgrG [Desulfobulbaceae bacterium]
MAFFRLSANESWFDFRVTSGKTDFGELKVYAFSGVERVNAPYEFSIEVVSDNANLDLTTALGKECLLTIGDRDGDKHPRHGCIRQIEQGHSGNASTFYRVHMVPRLWFLSQAQGYHIHRRQRAPRVIEAVLRRHRFVAGSYDFRKLRRDSYPEKEYVVQYGESDLGFIDRICQEEGIIYFFTHQEDMHCLCFTDLAGGPRIAGNSTIGYQPGSGQAAETAVISSLQVKERINSDACVYREYNFMMPTVDLTVHRQEMDWKKAPAPRAMKLEMCQFPHLYQTRDDGERYIRLQLQRQLNFRERIKGKSDVARFVPGCTFTLNGHPRKEVNRDWWLFKVRHEGKQPGVLQQEAPAGRGLEYKSTFTAIPDDVRFVPEIVNKKARIDGVQSAVVIGPKGAEVHTDKYGRILVRLHWPRAEADGETSIYWARLSQGWAGANCGFMQIPRVGEEVLVEFMDGDPERPVITGRVHNAGKMPPYALPDNQTRTVFKSMSTPGSEKGPRGYNELSIQDMLGSEEISVRAERNVTFDVKNDWNETIQHDRSSYAKGKSLIKADDIIQVDGGKTLIIQAGGQSITLDASGIKSSVPIHVGGSPVASPDAATAQTAAGSASGPAPDKADTGQRLEKLEKSEQAREAKEAEGQKKTDQDGKNKENTSNLNVLLAAGGAAVTPGNNKLSILSAALGALGDKDGSLVKELTGHLTGAVKSVTDTLQLGLDTKQVNSIVTGILGVGAGVGAAVLTAKATGKSAADLIQTNAGKLVTTAVDGFITATPPRDDAGQKKTNDQGGWL